MTVLTLNSKKGETMKRKKSFGVLASVLVIMILAVAIVILSSNVTPAAAPVKHIKIGTIMGLTGPLSVPSIAFDRGWDFYGDKLKEMGGIKIGNDHYVFDFIHEDSKGAAETAGTAANKLVTQDKVKFVIGAMLERSTGDLPGDGTGKGALWHGQHQYPGTPRRCGPEETSFGETFRRP